MDDRLPESRLLSEGVFLKRGITADTALRLARYKKTRTIEREVEPLSVLQPAMA